MIMDSDSRILDYKTFTMDEPEKTTLDNEKIAIVLRGVKLINCKIDLIFGGHVLLDGQLKDITKKD